MITKLTLSELDGFRAIHPSKHTTQVTSSYKLSVRRTGTHLNRALFKHFNGCRYLVFYLKAQYIAVAKANKDTPNAVRVRISKGRYYQTITNEALNHTLMRRLHGFRKTIIAEPKDVHKDYVIFNICRSK